MANVYPSQERYLDPYATYYSDNVNKISRIITKKTDCIISNKPVNVEIDPDNPTTNLIVRAGNFVKDDVVIEILEDVSVDMQNNDFYISGDPFNEAGTYYLAIDYTYMRAKPPVQASLIILKPSQYYWLTDRFLFLKAIIVTFNGSTFEISSISDYDPEPPYALRSNTSMYLPMIEGSGSSCLDLIGSYDGTIYGATWTERNMYFKNALRFGGIDSDYVQLSNNILTLTNPFTVTAFFNFDSGDSSPRRRRIVTLLNGANTFEFGVHTSERRFVGRINGVSFSSQTGILDPNTWYFVAVSVTSSSSINIYYSSVFDTITSATMGTAGMTSDPTSSSIGGGLTTYHWLGSICEVRALNIAVTSDQAIRLMVQPWLVDHAKRVYTETYASLESKLNTFDPLVDMGKIIYVGQPGVAYIGTEDGWNEFGVFDYTCDTSLCTLHQLAYIGANNIAHPAIADSAQHFASCFVTKVDATEGRVRISGKISDGLVETGITLSSGDPLFLSSTQAGKVTNIDPHVNTQLIGICLSTSGSNFETILSSLSGGSGVSVHNLLTGLEGGGGGHYYHLNLTNYTSLTAFGGNHNSIPYGLQGGSATERYHLTLAQYTAVNSFGGNHNSIPSGLQGGSATERYHFNLANYTALTSFAGNHNSCPTGLQGGSATERYHLTSAQASAVASFGGNHNTIPSGLQGGNSTERYHLTAAEYDALSDNLSSVGNVASLKSYIMTLLNYNQDIYDIKDKDLYTNDQNIDNPNVGDVISGDKISNIGTPYETFGVFGSFIGSNWTTTTDMTEAKSLAASFSLSNDIGMVAGGTNSSGTALGTSEVYSLSGNTWSSRASFTGRERNRLSGNTSSTNIGIIAGGWNTTGYLQQTDRYTYSSNAWATRANIGYNVGASGSLSLTSDINVIVGGYNGSAYLASGSKYTLSTNAWAILPCSLSYSKRYMASISLTWDGGIVAGGNNGVASATFINCEKLSLASSTWVTRSNLPYYNAASVGISQHSNYGLVVCGGSSSTYIDNNLRYNDSANVFEAKEDCATARAYHMGSSYDATTGVISGGLNTGASYLASGEKFIDTYILTDLSNKKFFMTDSSEATPLHHKVSSVNITTVRLTNRTESITKLLTSVLFRKQSSTSEITYRASLNDGTGWLSSLSLDENVDVSSLSPSGSNYYLRMSFNIPINTNADTWTAGLTMPIKKAFAAFSLSNYEGITAGGQNTSGFLGTSEKYNDSTPSWTTRSSITTVRYFLTGFQLKRNIGLIAGGANSTSPYNLCETFSDSGNIWSSITNLNIARTDPSGFRLSDNLGIVVGGNNGAFVSETEKYSGYYFTWIFVNNNPVGRDGAGGLSFTTDTGLSAAGQNGSICGSTEKYFDSMNVWTSRTPANLSMDDMAEISLTPNYGLISCGNNGYWTLKTQMYNDPGNIWTFRKDYTPEAKSSCGGISLTSNTGVVCGGEIGIGVYTGSLGKYNYGETTFIGFASLLFS